MPGHELTLLPDPPVTLLDACDRERQEGSIITPEEPGGVAAEQPSRPDRGWSVRELEKRMAALVAVAGRNLDVKLAKLPDIGDFELTDAQVRVLHAAIRVGEPVWAHKIFLTLIAEGDEPSAEAVRKSMERLAKLGLLSRSEHPVPSPDGAARWTYEVRQPAADAALERERYRRLMLVQLLGSYPEGLHHVLLNDTLDNPEPGPVPERRPETSGIG